MTEGKRTVYFSPTTRIRPAAKNAEVHFSKEFIKYQNAITRTQHASELLPSTFSEIVHTFAKTTFSEKPDVRIEYLPLPTFHSCRMLKPENETDFRSRTPVVVSFFIWNEHDGLVYVSQCESRPMEAGQLVGVAWKRRKTAIVTMQYIVEQQNHRMTRCVLLLPASYMSPKKYDSRSSMSSVRSSAILRVGIFTYMRNVCVQRAMLYMYILISREYAFTDTKREHEMVAQCIDVVNAYHVRSYVRVRACC